MRLCAAPKRRGLPCAGFLEIEHCGTSYLRLLGARVPLEAPAPASELPA